MQILGNTLQTLTADEQSPSARVEDTDTAEGLHAHEFFLCLSLADPRLVGHCRARVIGWHPLKLLHPGPSCRKFPPAIQEKISNLQTGQRLDRLSEAEAASIFHARLAAN